MKLAEVCGKSAFLWTSLSHSLNSKSWLHFPPGQQNMPEVFTVEEIDAEINEIMFEIVIITDGGNDRIRCNNCNCTHCICLE